MVEPNAPDRNRKGNAILGSAVFLALAPGFVGGVVPGVITGWEVGDHLAPPLRALGACLSLFGIAFLLRAFARFALEGLGTPAPVAPTERLVAGGVYRFVPNPMYLAVLAVIVGQALFFGNAWWPGMGRSSRWPSRRSCTSMRNRRCAQRTALNTRPIVLGFLVGYRAFGHRVEGRHSRHCSLWSDVGGRADRKEVAGIVTRQSGGVNAPPPI